MRLSGNPDNRLAEFLGDGGESITCERDAQTYQFADLVKVVAGKK